MKKLAWKWKKIKSYGDNAYCAKLGMMELTVWQVYDVGHKKDPIWLTAVDIKISSDYTGTLYPRNHAKFDKAKKFAEQAAETWIKKFNKSLTKK